MKNAEDYEIPSMSKSIIKVKHKTIIHRIPLIRTMNERSDLLLRMVSSGNFILDAVRMS